MTLTLDDEIDVSRGDMLVRRNNLPHVASDFEAMLCWMDEERMDTRTPYLLKHTTQKVKAYVRDIRYRIDVNTLHREDSDGFGLNEIGRVSIRTSRPVFFDSYQRNRATGSFILIDPVTNRTVAAGMIRERTRSVKDVTRTKHAESRRSTNVRWEDSDITTADWEARNGHRGAVIWCTGYSGAGKTTVARGLVRALFAEDRRVMMLDGDNVRHGLCGDLGFNDQDRSENIRRVGEAAKLFYQQGNIVVCTFISPFRADRDFVRSILPEDAFHEVYVKCDLGVCRRRDPKGLYAKAEAGLIRDFTGIDSPYEEPTAAEIVIETDLESVETVVGRIYAYLQDKRII